LKKRIALFLTALVVLGFVLVAGGCNLFTTTVEQRIDDFLSDLNHDSGRTKISDNLHPDVSAAWNDPATWDVSPFAYGNRTFSLSGLDYGDNVTGTIVSGGGLNDPIYFDMQKDTDGSWYIKRVDINGATIIQ
jgi:hypothetical protein